MLHVPQSINSNNCWFQPDDLKSLSYLIPEFEVFYDSLKEYKTKCYFCDFMKKRKVVEYNTYGDVMKFYLCEFCAKKSFTRSLKYSLRGCYFYGKMVPEEERLMFTNYLKQLGFDYNVCVKYPIFLYNAFLRYLSVVKLEERLSLSFSVRIKAQYVEERICRHKVDLIKSDDSLVSKGEKVSSRCLSEIFGVSQTRAYFLRGGSNVVDKDDIDIQISDSNKSELSTLVAIANFNDNVGITSIDSSNNDLQKIKKSNRFRSNANSDQLSRRTSKKKRRKQFRRKIKGMGGPIDAGDVESQDFRDSCQISVENDKMNVDSDISKIGMEHSESISQQSGGDKVALIHHKRDLYSKRELENNFGKKISHNQSSRKFRDVTIGENVCYLDSHGGGLVSEASGSLADIIDNLKTAITTMDYTMTKVKDELNFMRDRLDGKDVASTIMLCYGLYSNSLQYNDLIYKLQVNERLCYDSSGDGNIVSVYLSNDIKDLLNFGDERGIHEFFLERLDNDATYKIVSVSGELFVTNINNIPVKLRIYSVVNSNDYYLLNKMSFNEQLFTPLKSVIILPSMSLSVNFEFGFDKKNYNGFTKKLSLVSSVSERFLFHFSSNGKNTLRGLKIRSSIDFKIRPRDSGSFNRNYADSGYCLACMGDDCGTLFHTCG